MKENKENSAEKSKLVNGDRFIVHVGSLIQNGPNVNSSKAALDDFFNRVKKFNEENDKEIVRVYHPNGEKITKT